MKNPKLRAEGTGNKELEYWHSRVRRNLRDHLFIHWGHKLISLLRPDAWGKVRSQAKGELLPGVE